MRIEIGANEAGQRTDKFMRKVLGDVPLSKIYKAFRKGDIRVNGSKIKEKHSLVEGDIVETKYITSEFKKDEFVRIDNKLKITFEDANILMVEKWPGVLVHADKKDGEPTLTDYALSYLFDKGDYKPENEITFTPAPCNRLDRNTSGMVIFGKNFKSLKLLNEMIRDRNIEKYYMALVSGRIKDGIYEGYIYKNEDANISQVFKEPKPDTKRIAMDVKTIESCGTFSLLDINLLTGRSHQLRAHLSMLGNPILGDPKYGNKKINSFFNNKYGLDSQYLYAYKLIFKNCPEDLSYMENKTIAESLPPALKKIKRDIFKF
ncbi:RluA family pseudouridine synthase [Clostridium estertheticum]|uniref:RNA pseudouridylate synthase n=2 Tax=Clostridium TaxID=1485 RepID=A0AA47I7E2_9CLOT|nr:MULTISPECIES: RluA family pseudouridine synthase [Clostridium]MBU3098316.1 RluA family pseudouridine synthase [Clostridium sp. DSM 17811]MBU3153441.1 RluA family pseudouridine synthase [Clostridium estertheticum]MBU3177606.1 RluA family pseudouridine synthase [Clostridium estertheticum]MBU3198310.1 RluA family pseudouridine synthase [Clostridium estertheticum]MCB2354453.1 RluA family pseudouridine synthase [Clostridium estertheticum]